MTSMRTTIVGRLGKDPELRFTAGGLAVTSFSVAHTERKKQGEDWVDGDTVWLDVTCWERLGEYAAEVLQKGTLVMITGKIIVDKWKDQNGNNRITHKIKADEVAVHVASLAERRDSQGGERLYKERPQQNQQEAREQVARQVVEAVANGGDPPF